MRFEYDGASKFTPSADFKLYVVLNHQGLIAKPNWHDLSDPLLELFRLLIPSVRETDRKHFTESRFKS
jgi:hypothetical protein